MKHLFLFTVNYPYEHGEHLLEYEINYLKKYFDTITIINNNKSTEIKYKIPLDINVIKISTELKPLQKLFGFQGIFKFLFWQELWIIIFRYKQVPSFPIILTLLNSITRGNFVKLKLKGLFRLYDNYDDEIYCYSWWITTMTIGFTMLKNEFKKIKTCSRARAIDIYFEQNKNCYLPLRYYIYNNLDSVFFISNQGKNYTLYKLKGLLNDSRFKIHRMGTLQNSKVEIKLSENSYLRIVSCSDIIPLKRINLIIDTLQKLNHYNIEWIHFGTGYLGKEIKYYAKLKLFDMKNIKYEFKGYLINAELLKYYATNFVDLFVNLSTTEGIPVSIMEAYSFGIPSIATDVGGVSEIVNEYNGVLIPKNCSAELISQKIRDFIILPNDKKIELRRNAFETWRKEYNLQENFNCIAGEISRL